MKAMLTHSRVEFARSHAYFLSRYLIGITRAQYSSPHCKLGKNEKYERCANSPIFAKVKNNAQKPAFFGCASRRRKNTERAIDNSISTKFSTIPPSRRPGLMVRADVDAEQVL